MKGTERRVSVILPVFNGESHVRETVESALRQSYPNIELIVVDDGSTDRSAAIVDELSWRDSRIRLLAQPNGGVASARNLAIANATGEFIAPLDADDIWDRTKIERQVARFNAAGARTGLVYTWWAWIDARGDVLDVSPPWAIEGDGLETLLEINFVGNASVPLFRRSCLEHVGAYDPGLRDRGGQGCEDWDVSVRIAEHFHVAVTPAILVGYRRRSDSMSSSVGSMQRSQTLFLDSVGARRPELVERISRRSKEQMALHLAGVAFWSGKYLHALRLGLTTVRSGTGIDVLPYLPRVFAQRLLPRWGGPAVNTTGGEFAQCAFPTALIPYDRIHARRRRREDRRARQEG